MRTNLNTIRRHCQRAVRIAAPHEFGAVPIYILFDSELPADAHLEAGIGGMVWSNFDLCLRPCIKKWRGRGPCLILGESTWKTAATRAHAFADTVGIALHEVSHLLADGWTPSALDDSTKALATLPTPAAAVKLHHAPSDPGRVGLYCNLYAHDSRFIRVLCHARYRAGRRGMCTGGWDVGAYVQGLSWLLSYDADLHDEARAMEGAAFSEILKQSPPAAFVDRWNSDLDSVVAKHGGAALAEDLYL